MNFDKKTLWDLRQEIRLGSLFYRDYENSYGVDEHDCCDFFDSFIEWYEYERKDPKSPYYQNKDSWFYDNPEDLWDYYCMYEDEALPIQKDEDDDWEYESRKIKRVKNEGRPPKQFLKQPYIDKIDEIFKDMDKVYWSLQELNDSYDEDDKVFSRATLYAKELVSKASGQLYGVYFAITQARDNSKNKKDPRYWK